LDNFFSFNNGKLFDRFGLKWEVTDSKKGFFSSKYESEITLILPGPQTLKIASFSHNANFGLKSLGSIGNVETIGKISINRSDIAYGDIGELEELAINKDFNFNSILTFSGIKNSKIIDKESAVTESGISYDLSNFNSNFFISYDHDAMDVNANLGSLNLSHLEGDIVFELKDSKYSDHLAKSNGFWFGSGDISAKKLFISADVDGELINVINVEDYKGKGAISKQNSELFKLAFEATSKYMHIADKDINETLKDVVYKESFENLDIANFSSALSTLSTLNLGYDPFAAGMQLFSLAEKGLKILEKQPKYSIQVSAIYDDEKQDANAFVQYVGNPSELGLYANFAAHFAGGFELNAGEKLFDKALNYFAQTEAKRESGDIDSLFDLDYDTLDKYLVEYNVDDMWELSAEQAKHIIDKENEKRREKSGVDFDNLVNKIAQRQKEELKDKNIEPKDGRVKVNFNYDKGSASLNGKHFDKDNLDKLLD
jgi:hypothetical protein